MVLNLRYFIEFVYDIVVKQLLGLLLGLPRFQNVVLIVYDHMNTIRALIQRLFGQKVNVRSQCRRLQDGRVLYMWQRCW